MIIINIHEAKTKLSKLLVAVEQEHETVRICRHGLPIADLVPVTELHNPLQQHHQLSKIKVLPAAFPESQE